MKLTFILYFTCIIRFVHFEPDIKDEENIRPIYVTDNVPKEAYEEVSITLCIITLNACIQIKCFVL